MTCKVCVYYKVISDNKIINEQFPAKNSHCCCCMGNYQL